MRKPAFLTKAGEWLKRHKADVVVVVALMAIGGTVSGLNMTGYPQRFEDEGTYVSQAWAIKENNTLAHYTYWYDHPPAGWIQIAAYLTVFQGLERYGSAITAGREFMLVLHIATIGLLYALARRLAIGRIAAFAGVLFYALSPLTVEFGRYVLLDNVALPWLLGAFLLALSPKRSLGTGVGAAACMAIAILSKETFLALLPVLLYCLWRSGDPRNRRYVIAVFSVVFVMLSATYVLYAALKNELFPGAGHVSLIGTFFWQLFGREGTGSIFDPGSDGYGLVAYWLDIDYILLAAGAISMLPALIFRNLRPAGLVMFISLALMLRNGYLPYPYVIILLPFAALCVAGAIDRLLVRSIADRRHWLPLRLYAGVAAAELLVAIALFVVPVWQQKLTTAMTADVDNTSRMAVEWVKDNVASSGRLVVESALWTDLETQGFTESQLVWLYKTETDPSVKNQIGGWQGIEYVILNGPTVYDKDFKQSFPTVATALENGRLVAEYGEGKHKVVIFKIADQQVAKN